MGTVKISAGNEIIKCKDCKCYIESHYEDDGEPPYVKGKCKYSNYRVYPEHFCGFAERNI